MKVKLFATLREGRFIEKEWEYSDGMTVGRILEELAIDTKDGLITLVNSRVTEPDYKLAEGDTLSIFPLVGGG